MIHHPVITCPADATVDCSNPGALNGEATATDDCHEVVITHTDGPITGPCNNETFVRTWIATDECGNSSSCEQQLTITDVTPPVITCPADATVDCSNPSALNGVATATDDCHEVVITHSDGPMTGLCPETFVRTWVATDECDNSSTCTQTMTVIDDTPPVITCPADATVDCSNPGALNGEATATDDCHEVVITHSDGPMTGLCPETFVRTWVATDECNNSSTCTQTMTVIDDTPPVITCPADATVDCSDPGALNGEATAIDDCHEVLITHTDGPITGPCTNATFIRTWVATDECGNSSSCEQQLTITDDTPPVITCPADATVDCNNPGALNGEATATDDCYEVVITHSDGPMTGLCPETFVRTWVATDECDNSSSCTQTMTVVDDTPPVITCPADATVDCSNPGALNGEATATDDCHEVVITHSDGPLTGLCPETFVRTWVATDECNNSSTCTQTMTVIDDTPPVITCPEDATIDCSNPSGLNGEATAIDDCHEVIITHTDGPISGPCTNATFVRTWVATDECGNSSSCEQQLTITDDTPPVITCPADATVDCNNPGALNGEATATDDCYEVVITHSDGPMSGLCPETFVRTWVATDECDNSSSCTQTMTVVDDTPPVITCPADATVDCSNPGALNGEATATDDCHEVVITHSDGPMTGLCPETFVRTWVATDECNNSATCTQTMTVIDDTPPVITCPEDATIDCSNPSGLNGEATAIDDCHEVTVDFSDGPITGPCNNRTFVRTWTAEDECGNSSSCDQTLTIVDETPPAITCPADITIECDESTDQSNTGTATASDDCNDVTISFTDLNIDDADCINEGSIIRTWIATDGCNNSSTCNQEIKIVDTTAPMIDCPANVTVECDESTDPHDVGIPTATDNCGLMIEYRLAASQIPPDFEDLCELQASIIYEDSFIQGDCPEDFVIERTWGAVDNCGNTSTCVQFIQVVDSKPPTIECPADLTIECDENTHPNFTGIAIAQDNCDEDVTISFNDVTSSGDCPAEYTITRTWMAEDNCGNMAACIQTIKVDDTTPPEITCPIDVTVSCDSGLDPAITGAPTAEDNCTVVITYDFSDDADLDGCNGGGIIERTWTATDECGNTASCVQLITVEDGIPPVISCPADITIECDESTDPSNTGNASAVDNCDDTPDVTFTDFVTAGICPDQRFIQRTWLAEDVCGNVSSCVQSIRVDDLTPPVITCPADVTIECDESTDPANTGNASAVDNCDDNPNVTFTDFVTAGICPEQRFIQRTWLAEDDCGNVSSCVQSIRVDDLTPPVITCPTDVTVECDESTDPGNTGNASAVDNCDDNPNVTFTDFVTAGICPEQRFIQRTWLAEDDCGNVSSCVQSIRVDDLTPPVITCPIDITVECDESTDPANTGNASAVDNCDDNPNVTFTDFVTAGICPEQRFIQRTWLAEDDCGNAVTCVQSITVEDSTPPVFTNVPADTTIDCDDPGTGIGTATASDNCDTDVDISYEDVVGDDGCAGDGITRIWRATDNCGNSVTATQNITVNDDQAPTISGVGPDMTIECDETPVFSNPNASDNCDSDVAISSDDTSASDNCAGGSVTRTWTATDDCGNTSTASQTITFEDTTPPVFVDVPSDITVDCDEAAPGPGSASAEDNCDTNVDISYEDTEGEDGCAGDGITRTWTATDDCGNSATAVQNITLEDDQAPTISGVGPDMTIECDETPVFSNPSASDNCDNDVVLTSEDTTEEDNCAGGSVTRTWTATDDCGNTSTASQTITFEDTTPPVFVNVPSDITIDCEDGTADPGTATASDNCDTDVDISYEDVVGDDGCAGDGITPNMESDR